MNKPRGAKKALSLLLAAVLMLTLLPSFGATVQAQSSGTLIDVGDSLTTSGTGWTLSGNVFTVIGDVTITGATTTNRIVVQSGANVNITFDDMDIDVSSLSDSAAFDMTGATVNLTLVGDNKLSGGIRRAGLQAPSGSTLTIGGTGNLTATGGSGGAGIGGSSLGGGSSVGGGSITITGGTVTAMGGLSSAGIGGGSGGAGIGGTITIAGGTVTAIGGPNGAGIGSGNSVEGGSITITGGTVTATGGLSSAGIGGGYYGAGGTITIAGGTVTATGGGQSGAGIGGGVNSGGGSITISSGIVIATGGTGTAAYGGGAGIGSGGGSGGAGGTITIAGGTVSANGGSTTLPWSGGGAGIGSGGGGGTNTAASGSITIMGYANVTASGGNVSAPTNGQAGGAGIGSGGSGSPSTAGAAGNQANPIIIEGTVTLIPSGGTGVNGRNGAAIGMGGGISAGTEATLHTVTATAGTGGTISPSDIRVSQGGSLTFTVTADSGYEISSVTVGGTPQTVTNPDGFTFNVPNVTTDLAVVASFEPISLFVPVTSITNVPTTATAGSPLPLSGMVSPSDATHQEITWSVVDAGATGATISGGNTLNTTVAGTVIVRATITNGATETTNYTQDFTITVNAPTQQTFAVIVIGGKGGGNYPAGATVNIEADVPPPGYYFENWTTTSNGVTFQDANAQNTTFTMPANAVTVTANFEPLPEGEYSISVQHQGNGVANPSVTHAKPGTQITLKATPDSGNRFIRWEVISGTITLSSTTTATATFYMPNQNVVVKAYFEAIPSGPGGSGNGGGSGNNNNAAGGGSGTATSPKTGAGLLVYAMGGLSLASFVGSVAIFTKKRRGSF